MPAHADVDHPAVRSADLEPVDEGLGRDSIDIVQHGRPHAYRVGSSVQAVTGSFDAHTHGRVQLPGLGIETLGEKAAKGCQRFDERS